MKHCCLLLIAFCCAFTVNAQYAPQEGIIGSTAIPANSAQIVGWANGCTVQRGYKNIAVPDSGYASAGDQSLGLGPCDHQTVSLGDSGVAVLTFSSPIYNGPGADFVVFENGFLDQTNDSLAFLELAFVEVSSDGISFYRFQSTSLTQTGSQITNADYINAANLNNLAGKYIGGYGTPFDLSELNGIQGLDINNITHVRLTDVVGSINGHSSHDGFGHLVNDPYPTPFASSGFDLDAVGVMNMVGVTGLQSTVAPVSVKVYPNPATEKLTISLKESGAYAAVLSGVTGNRVLQTTLQQGANELQVAKYPAGIYYLTITDEKGNRWAEKITKL